RRVRTGQQAPAWRPPVRTPQLRTGEGRGRHPARGREGPARGAADGRGEGRRSGGPVHPVPAPSRLPPRLTCARGPFSCVQRDHGALGGREPSDEGGEGGPACDLLRV